MSAADPGPDSSWALVLAGGDGTRLQHLTHRLTGSPIPKQYCRILGERSMLEHTLHRIAPVVPPDRTMVVLNRSHLPVARPQLSGVPRSNWIVQPSNRDTGPGLLLSLLALRERAGNAVVAIFPSDHFVADDARFRRYVRGAVNLASAPSGPVVLLGIRPDRVEPGFGYIRPASRLEGERAMAAFRVAGFTEKPAYEEARTVVRSGGLWSTFVMASRVGRLLDLVATLRPHDHQRMARAWRSPRALDALYAETKAWNFSRDVLALAPDALVVLRADRTGWSDWGTPEAIERTLASLAIEVPWRRPSAQPA